MARCGVRGLTDEAQENLEDDGSVYILMVVVVIWVYELVRFYLTALKWVYFIVDISQ